MLIHYSSLCIYSISKKIKKINKNNFFFIKVASSISTQLTSAPVSSKNLGSTLNSIKGLSGALESTDAISGLGGVIQKGGAVTKNFNDLKTLISAASDLTSSA